MKRVCILAAVGLVLVGCQQGGGGQQQRSSGGTGQTYSLKMSTQLNESNPMVEGFKTWGKNVEERSGGKIKIQVYPSAQLGSDEDVIEQALQGVNVAVLTDAGRMANYAKNIGIIGMPYIADNYDELRKLTETQTFAEWDVELQKKGIRILSYNWYDGPRHFITNKPIEKPADLNGLRIRTPGAPVWAKSVEAMGATPIAMGWNDTYNAIQSKSIDGAEVQNTSAYGARIYEVVKYINKTGHFQLANFIMVGEKWFSRLPAEYQQILMEECKKASYENAKMVEIVSAEYEELMVGKGMEIIQPDIAAFKQAADKAYTELGFTDLRNQLWREMGK